MSEAGGILKGSNLDPLEGKGSLKVRNLDLWFIIREALQERKHRRRVRSWCPLFFKERAPVVPKKQSDVGLARLTPAAGGRRHDHAQGGLQLELDSQCRKMLSTAQSG